MTKPIKQFTVVDPATFDGDCFDVAERVFLQSAGIAAILKGTLKSARAMALNAEMERQLFAAGECSAPEFENSAQARRIDAAERDAVALEQTLIGLSKAAGYNPRKPVRT